MRCNECSLIIGLCIILNAHHKNNTDYRKSRKKLTLKFREAELYTVVWLTSEATEPANDCSGEVLMNFHNYTLHAGRTNRCALAEPRAQGVICEREAG